MFLINACYDLIRVQYAQATCDANGGSVQNAASCPLSKA